MRRLVIAGVSLSLAVTLNGCGNPREDYCKAITADQVQLSAMINSSGADSLITNLPLLRSLAAKAPADLTDEWQTFINAIQGLRDALSQAHLRPGAFQGGKMPDSVQGQQRRDIIAAANTLSSTDVVSAANGIETQARDVCKVNLGL